MKRVPFERLHARIVHHDDKWLFVILYVSLAVILSIWISLFWLVAVVAVHLGFELMRQSYLRSGFLSIMSEVLWELKLDIALVLFALVLALYMEIVLGVAGLGIATRVGLQSGARAAGWSRMLRGFLLSVDDLAQVTRAVSRRGLAALQPEDTIATIIENSAETPPPRRSPWGSWAAPWGKGDWVAIILGLVCLGFLAATPWLTDHTLHSMVSTLYTELHPFPWRIL